MIPPSPACSRGPYKNIQCLSAASENKHPSFLPHRSCFLPPHRISLAACRPLSFLQSHPLHHSSRGSCVAVRLPKARGSSTEKVDQEWFRSVVQVSDAEWKKKEHLSAGQGVDSFTVSRPLWWCLGVCVCACAHPLVCPCVLTVCKCIQHLIVTDLINFEADRWGPDSP